MSFPAVARVAVEKTNYDFDTLYDYLIPESLVEKLTVGYRVIVPFGGGVKGRHGFVFELSDAAEKTKNYKYIKEICDPEPLLSEKDVETARWISDRTFCTLYEAAKAMLPAGLSLSSKANFCRMAYPDPEAENSLTPEEKAVYDAVPSMTKFISEDALLKKFGLTKDNPIIPKLLKKELIYANYYSAGLIEHKGRKTAILSENADQVLSLVKLTPKQKAMLDVLRDAGSASVSELCYFTGLTASVLTALEYKGLVEIREVQEETKPSSFYEEEGEMTPIHLTDEQQAAFDSLKADAEKRQASCSLLFGVTGSGKTSVYLRLIDEMLPAGRGIILMVPEIALTPQTLSLLYGRYGKKIAVFHSGLSTTERMDEWKRVRTGEAKIAVGTRSAVFAPFRDVGLIIIDEEQEHTYKSSRSPRYNAIEVAKYLVARDGGLLLLASATPSVTTYYKALSGKHKLLKLTKRYGNAVLPRVEVSDITQLYGKTAVSEDLRNALSATLEDGKQAILLMNRRGYNTFAVCTSCRQVVSCPNCSLSLTYHSANHRLMCHYCGYSTPYTPTCPSCGGKAIRYSGYGTQWVEKELSEQFPNARILRMDADTTMTKGAHEKMLRLFGDGEYDVMIGTQMVAKGLDFPRVTLTGVVTADVGVYKDDYRSTERSFDLLTQLIGRAGRREAGGVAVIQTVSPDNEVINLAAKQDYEAFYENEIENRRLMIYPPFCDLCVVGFVADTEIAAKNCAYEALQTLQGLNGNEYADVKLMAIGPTPCVIRRISNKYRYRLLIKCRNNRRFRGMIRDLLISLMKDKRYKDVSVFADVNPADIF